MVCTECAFFYGPKLSLIIGSLLVSLFLFLMIRKFKGATVHKKLALIYGHLFTLVFPFVFYALFRGCQQIFSSCDSTEKILYLVLITAGISFLIGVLAAPVIFLRKYRKNSIGSDPAVEEFVKAESRKMKIKN